MVGFELLSPALINIMNQAVGSQNLVKYLYYNTTTPIMQVDISDPTILQNKNIFPAPFDQELSWEDCVQLRVFFLSGLLKDNQVVDNTKVIFDVICAKTLWLINDGQGHSQVRPYQIMAEIEKQFRDISIPYAGELVFENFHHLTIDKQFDGVRLIAGMTLFSDGKS